MKVTTGEVTETETVQVAFLLYKSTTYLRLTLLQKCAIIILGQKNTDTPNRT